MKVMVTTELTCVPHAFIDIPEIDSWEEVDWWYVKWDTLHYGLKHDDVVREIELETEPLEHLNSKTPIRTSIESLDEDGDPYKLIDEI